MKKSRFPVLVTNDDGVRSPLLLKIASELSQWADVTVIAPKDQQSGASKANTFSVPIRATKVNLSDKINAWHITGTPADAVLFAISPHFSVKPKLVVSGINAGANIAVSSILTSGTVGAAFEAAIWGIPAISASIHTTKEYWYDDIDIENNLEAPARILSKICDHFASKGFPARVRLININFPENTRTDTPIRITRPALRWFINRPQKRLDPHGQPYFWITGERKEPLVEGTDVAAVIHDEVVSITPIDLQLTDTQMIMEMHKSLHPVFACQIEELSK
ncbi:MAG: 5'/3'-nucleotidase SurE [Candidatus Ranarchaeia archaeon]